MKHKYSFDAEVLFAPFLDPTAIVPFRQMTEPKRRSTLLQEGWYVEK